MFGFWFSNQNALGASRAGASLACTQKSFKTRPQGPRTSQLCESVCMGRLGLRSNLESTRAPSTTIRLRCSRRAAPQVREWRGLEALAAIKAQEVRLNHLTFVSALFSLSIQSLQNGCTPDQRTQRAVISTCARALKIKFLLVRRVLDLIRWPCHQYSTRLSWSVVRTGALVPVVVWWLLRPLLGSYFQRPSLDTQWVRCQVIRR